MSERNAQTSPVQNTAASGPRSGRDKYFAFADQIAVSLGRFAVAVLVGRFASTEAFATFFLLATVEIMVALVLLSLLVRPFAILLPRLDDEQARSFLQGSMVLTNLVSGVLLVLCIASGLLVGGDLGGTIAAFGAWMAFGLPFQVLRRIEFSRFRAQRVAVASLASFVVGVSAIGVLALGGWLQASGVFQCLAVGNAVALFLLLRGQQWLARGSLGSILETLLTVWPIGRFSCAGSIANSLCTRAHPYVLQAAAGAASVSSLGMLMTVVGPMRMVTGAVESALLPRIAVRIGAGDGRGASRLLWGACALVGLLALGVALPLLIWPLPLMRLAFGSGYPGDAFGVRLIALYAPLVALGTLMVSAAQCFGHAGKVFRNRLFALGLAAVLAWPLMVNWGTSGALLTMLIVEGVALVLLVPLVRIRPTEETANDNNATHSAADDRGADGDAPGDPHPAGRVHLPPTGNARAAAGVAEAGADSERCPPAGVGGR